jgi:dynein heavy chain 2
VCTHLCDLAPGDWLLLKNLHLVVPWLPTLEKEVYKLGAERHAGFRLFLASQPHAKFPPTLLERSIKVRTRQSNFTQPV